MRRKGTGSQVERGGLELEAHPQREVQGPRDQVSKDNVHPPPGPVHAGPFLIVTRIVRHTTAQTMLR